MLNENKSFLKHFLEQVVSGGAAGFIEICLMHPLDLVKTRLQIQHGFAKKATAEDTTMYRGVFDCLKKMYIHEGVFSFWKGILPPILAETPKRAIKFVTFEQTKRFFLFGSPTPTPLTFALAGMTAGIIDGIVVNPFEVVKVTMQANKKRMRVSPSTWSVTKEIIKNEGFGSRGLCKGLTATVSRAVVFNTCYFGFYHSVKGYFPMYENAFAELMRKVAIGFISGTIASCANIPLDVAKSRIQGPQPVPGQIKYKGTLQTLFLIYHEEGWRALYKGLFPKVLRLGPGGAIMLISFEYIYDFLQEKFPD